MKYVHLTPQRIVDGIFCEIPANIKEPNCFLERFFPIPDDVDVKIGMEYLPELNCFFDASTSSTKIRTRAEFGNDLKISISFPKCQDWYICKADGLNAEKRGNDLLISPQKTGVYTVSLLVKNGSAEIKAELEILIE